MTGPDVLTRTTLLKNRITTKAKENSKNLRERNKKSRFCRQRTNLLLRLVIKRNLKRLICCEPMYKSITKKSRQCSRSGRGGGRARGRRVKEAAEAFKRSTRESNTMK